MYSQFVFSKQLLAMCDKSVISSKHLLVYRVWLTEGRWVAGPPASFPWVLGRSGKGGRALSPSYHIVSLIHPQRSFFFCSIGTQ